MTYTKEEARSKIQRFVEDFRAHEATLEKAAEAQIENNFIRPLFRYLNWNTENKGLSHAHSEFKVQSTNKKGLRAVDESIDELVYELYGLSEEEIKIVEDG